MSKPCALVPERALAQHTAVVGMTGSGKTYAAKGLVEHLLHGMRRVGIVDPTGAWWGLRANASGKGGGFPILVLGGSHGDLPLSPLSGAAVARLLCEQGVNLVADTSQLTVGEHARWFIDFAGTVFKLNKSPLHLVIDEAHTFAPQGKVPDPDTGKMLHAANRLASGGRSRGIRLLMITQRPQKLHKDTLTSASTLIAMRLIAPQDRDAVREWVRGCGDEAQGKEVLDTLASLKRGEGWVWHPEGGHLERGQFPKIDTFDSSATPEDGHAIAAPKGMAEINLDEVKAAMSDAVKEAEANDPKLLRARIADLQRELAAAKKAPAQTSAKTTYWERTVEVAPSLDLLKRRAASLRKAVDEHLAVIDRELEEIPARVARTKQFTRMVDGPHGPQPATAVPPIDKSRANDRSSVAVKPPARAATPAPISATGGTVGKAERVFLAALAQQGRPLARGDLAIYAGYSPGSRHVDNTLGALRSRGLAEGDGSGISITADGRAALGEFTSLPEGEDLLNQWIGMLGAAEAAFVRALADASPGSLTRDELAVNAGYSPQSRHVDNTLGALRRMELAIGGKAAISLNAIFTGGVNV